MNRAQEIDLIFEKFSLRKTGLRRGLLQTFLKHRRPLSQAELIENLASGGHKIDRVSIYRNLGHLKDLGLIHEVDSNQYVFCHHECADHPHLLLFCQKCFKHSEILDHQLLEQIFVLLKRTRFFGGSKPLALKGICEGCAGGDRD